MLVLAGTPIILMYVSLERTNIGHSVPKPQVEVENPAEAAAPLPGTAASITPASIRPTQSPDVGSVDCEAYSTALTTDGTVQKLDC